MPRLGQRRGASAGALCGQSPARRRRFADASGSTSMATRIVEDTLPAPQRDSALSGTVVDAFSLDRTASLFSLVREEPFVEAAPKPVHISRILPALALQRCVDLTLAILFL